VLLDFKPNLVSEQDLNYLLSQALEKVNFVTEKGLPKINKAGQ
jgi:hypothetical protein